jgi:DNA-binding transcriptional LysR family regulator
MTFDLRQLHAFTTVVSTGSLGRAAAALNVTQPALSRTIRRLEHQVGAPLFERHSKGMQLTHIGTALLPHAALLRQESENAIEEINALRGLARGTVRVGAVGSIACLVLPTAIGCMLEKWPRLQVLVVEGVWDRLAHALTTCEIDLALGVSGPDTSEIVAIGDCRWEDCSHIVAAAGHPLRKKRHLKLADVMHERWALPPRGTGPYDQMAQMFAANGLGLPDMVVETRSITVLKSLVSNSGFLSWMGEPMYDTERKARVIAALDIPGASATRALTAFRRRSGMLPGPAIKLLDELRYAGSTDRSS